MGIKRHNTAIGHDAMESVTDQPGNTAVGSYAMGNGAASGSTNGYNTAIGYGACYQLTTGANNTAVGESALKEITTGDNNSCIGRFAGLASSPSGEISTGSNTICLGNNSVTDLYCADTSISSSDERDKTDITAWTHGLDWINKLEPITYRWDKRCWYLDDPSTPQDEGVPDGSKKSARLHLGFRAQNVLAVENEDGYATKKDDMLLVNLNEDNTAYGMKYERLVVVLTKAVQELSAKVEALESKLNN